MLNGRLYRVAFVPFVLALAVASFSLTARPQPLTSTLAPDAFEGAPALAELKSLAAEFPNRRPGSPGDEELAAKIAQTLEGLGAAGHGGFQVRTHRFQAQTIDGERTLETVLAQRAGSSGSGATPIVILAHRDASASGRRSRTVRDGRADRAGARVRGARDPAHDRARLDQRRQRRRRGRAGLRHEAKSRGPTRRGDRAGRRRRRERAQAVRGALLGRLRQRTGTAAAHGGGRDHAEPRRQPRRPEHDRPARASGVSVRDGRAGAAERERAPGGARAGLGRSDAARERSGEPGKAGRLRARGAERRRRAGHGAGHRSDPADGPRARTAGAARVGAAAADRDAADAPAAAARRRIRAPAPPPGRERGSGDAPGPRVDGVLRAAVPRGGRLRQGAGLAGRAVGRASDARAGERAAVPGARPCGRCWRWHWCWASAGWHGHGQCGGWAESPPGRRRAPGWRC